jgi:hypothetical protein
MSNYPHRQEPVSRLETWAFAFASALVVLITIGVLPAVHW